MIRFLTIFLFTCSNCFGNGWYLSSSTGNNSNTGTSSAQAWASLSKLNSSFASINAGDTIYLKRGDVFTGSIRVGKSGTISNRIVFYCYGSGSAPIVTGEVSLTNWTSTGVNKWMASVTADSTLTMITISGTPQMFARDSAGWKHYTAVSPTSIIYPHAGNWVGQTIVFKSDEWTISRAVITSDNGSLITFRKWYDINNGGAPAYGPTKNNFGFFRFNDTTFLDTQNEVVFNYPLQRIYVYSTTTPSNVKTTGVDTLMDISLRQYITVRGIRFRYGGLYGIYASSASNILIDSCQFEYFGAQAFGAYRLANTTIQNCTIDQCLQTGMYIQSVSSPYVNVSVLNNTMTNIGLLFGMGSFGQNPDYSGYGISSFTGLRCKGNSGDNIGDAGIKFSGNDAEVANNNITKVTMLTADRGCIYTFREINQFDTSYRKSIHNNFLSNTFGNLEGTPQETSRNPTIRSIGVYLDGRNAGDTVRDNTIWGIPGAAMSFNIDSNVTAYNNLVVLNDSIARYANAIGIRIQQLRNFAIKFFNFQNNIIFNTFSTQKQLQYTAGAQSPATIIGNFKAIGTINNNYYNLGTISNYQTEAGTPYGAANYTHPQYTSTFGFGVNDVSLPSYTLSQCLFLKNWSASTSLTTFIGKVYTNAQGQIFADSIRLQPYTGALLFPTTIAPIIVTIDSNPVITLPVNSTTISGIATFSGGTITGYQWRKKGGGAATITSPANRVTSLTGLVAGTYVFTLVATNNLGQTDSAFATVTVNPAPPPANVPPVVTITPNYLEITLPANSVTLTGSATDSDGSIVSYQWVKVSGTGGTIETPTTATTQVTGLTAGTYIYSLTATDNVGAQGSATAQVKVNPQPTPTNRPKLRIKRG